MFDAAMDSLLQHRIYFRCIVSKATHPSAQGVHMEIPQFNADIRGLTNEDAPASDGWVGLRRSYWLSIITVDSLAHQVMPYYFRTHTYSTLVS